MQSPIAKRKPSRIYAALISKVFRRKRGDQVDANDSRRSGCQIPAARAMSDWQNAAFALILYHSFSISSWAIANQRLRKLTGMKAACA
jgi:hypothetical protein